MNKNLQRQLYSDDDAENTEEGEGEISGSDKGSGMDEPDFDNVRRAEIKGKDIGIKDPKRSVG